MPPNLRPAGDTAYSARCLAAAKRCWAANPHAGDAVQAGWWMLAVIALHQATGGGEILRAAEQLAMNLAGLQTPHGFCRMAPGSSEPYKHAVHGALPPFALLKAARASPDSPAAQQWQAKELLAEFDRLDDADSLERIERELEGSEPDDPTGVPTKRKPGPKGLSGGAAVPLPPNDVGICGVS